MSKHTSGPWELCWEDGKHGVVAEAADHKLVAIIGNNPNDDRNDERKANAQLVSAAPDMLGALKQASFCLRELLPEDKEALFTLDIINQALAKAEGKQL